MTTIRIGRLDHALLYCPEEIMWKLTEFWASLGIKPVMRVEKNAIDHAGEGKRADFFLGEETSIVYKLTKNGETANPIPGHVAVSVDPESLRALEHHPDLDRTVGTNGLVDWGTHDKSAFLIDPAGNHIECRCTTAAHDLSFKPLTL